MKRNGSARWDGELQRGRGQLSVASGLLHDAPYSFATRFADERGTNPEELIAAAHAGCYSMALAFALGQAGVKPKRIDTRAEITLAMAAGVPSVTSIELSTVVSADGLDEAGLQRIADHAKETCLVSRLLTVKPTLQARLAPGEPQ